MQRFEKAVGLMLVVKCQFDTNEPSALEGSKSLYGVAQKENFIVVEYACMNT